MRYKLPKFSNYIETAAQKSYVTHNECNLRIFSKHEATIYLDCFHTIRWSFLCGREYGRSTLRTTPVCYVLRNLYMQSNGSHSSQLENIRFVIQHPLHYYAISRLGL